MQNRSVWDKAGSGITAGVAFIISVLWMSAARGAGDDLGQFETSTDVGRVELRGAVQFDGAKGQYRVSGSGANMWGTVDAFQFVWKKVAGDLELQTKVRWEGAGRMRIARRA